MKGQEILSIQPNGLVECLCTSVILIDLNETYCRGYTYYLYIFTIGIRIMLRVLHIFVFVSLFVLHFYGYFRFYLIAQGNMQ